MSKIHLDKIKKRPLSWSSLSSFAWDPKQWAQKYLDGKEELPSPELIFGKTFAESCENRKPLAPVRMLDTMEHEFSCKLGNIPLIGYADTICTDTFKILGEYKTGVKIFDKKRVDEMGQITMYLLMLWLTKKINPEDVEVFINWVPTKRVEKDTLDFSGYEYKIDFAQPITVRTFTTKRSMVDILNFAAYIKKTHKAMCELALNYKTVDK
jgi:hypothetical protein